MKLIAILIAAMLTIGAIVYQPTEVPLVEAVVPSPTIQQEQNEAATVIEETSPNEVVTPPVQQDSDTAPATDTDASAEMAETIVEVSPTVEEIEPLTKTVPAVVEPALTIEETVIVEGAKTDSPAVVEHAKTGAPDDVPVVVEHAKTGYEGEETVPTEPPVVEPEQPAEPADISTAIAAAEAFAIDTYNVTIDPTLDFTNSAYRFPTAVPMDASQEFLNNKAIGIVDYTFQQQIRQFGVTVEKIRETGIRCKVHIEQSGNDLLVYCFYA